MDTSQILMNYLLPLAIVIGFGYFMFLKPEKSKTEKNQYGEVIYSFLAPKDAKKRLDDENILIVDVRKEEYYEQSHIKNSVNLPFTEINKNCRKLIPNKKVEMLVYDNDGGNLSKSMVYELYHLGYKNVHNIGSMHNYNSHIVRPGGPLQDDAIDEKDENTQTEENSAE